MRNVRDELTTKAVLALDGGRHAVEGGAKGAELPRCVGPVDANGAMSGLDRSHGGGQGCDRGGHASSDEDGDDDGDDDGQGAAGEDRPGERIPGFALGGGEVAGGEAQGDGSVVLAVHHDLLGGRVPGGKGRQGGGGG